MKAAFINQYGPGDVITCGDLAEPIRQPGEVLVKVLASSVNPIDWKVRQGMLKILTGSKFPRILGSDLAGEVLEAGNGDRHLRPGDRVYGFIDFLKGGAYAEVIAIPEEAVALAPANLSPEQVAAVPLAGQTALQALRDLGQAQAGQKVLINGASGGVGTFAVQIAKLLSTEVTGVCSDRNTALVQDLGADRVIDYHQIDFTQEKIQYDLVFDVVGTSSFWKCRQVLSDRGHYITTNPTPLALAQRFFTRLLPGKTVDIIFVKSRQADLAQLRQWLEAGQLRVVSDRTFPLSDVAAAHAYSETGHAVGKISLTVTEF
jgi:NADPH:quinone reductase-like Zn-dependent oxidoreductase